MSDRRLRAVLGGLALVGAGITAYLVYSRYSGAPLACSTGGCETVQRSRYAEVAGVPVAVLGLAGYLGIGVTALGRAELARATGAALALAGLAFGAYLLVVQIAVLDAICQWCAASDVVIALAATASVLRLRARC